MDLDHFCYNCDSVLEISGRLGMVGDGGKTGAISYFGDTESAILDVVNILFIYMHLLFLLRYRKGDANL